MSGKPTAIKSNFRYIRSAGMLQSQPALGRLMGIDGQQVAGWEKTLKVPI